MTNEEAVDFESVGNCNFGIENGMLDGDLPELPPLTRRTGRQDELSCSSGFDIGGAPPTGDGTEEPKGGILAQVDSSRTEGRRVYRTRHDKFR
jgi:hypothetical protein